MFLAKMDVIWARYFCLGTPVWAHFPYCKIGSVNVSSLLSLENTILQHGTTKLLEPGCGCVTWPGNMCADSTKHYSDKASVRCSQANFNKTWTSLFPDPVIFSCHFLVKYCIAAGAFHVVQFSKATKTLLGITCDEDLEGNVLLPLRP